MDVLENIVYPDSELLIQRIEQYGSRDQSKTNVMLGTTKARVYSPHKHNYDHYDDYKRWLNSRPFVKSYGIVVDDSHLWGMSYSPDQYTESHNHPKFEVSGIHFLYADRGCGKLFIGNHEIEPNTNMVVMFPGSAQHWVEKATNPESRRVCMVFNISQRL